MAKKSTKKIQQIKPKELTKLEKMQQKADVMMENYDKQLKQEKQKKIDDYVEYKKIKGHSEEEAIMMANALLMDKMNE
tara:strand:- start:21132 stop:21365 length:234 start_codon:yes stop_codon:yes gene_type:complete